jgi:hypothetical protein
VNKTPSKTSTPLCPEEFCDRIVHIALDATHCKKVDVPLITSRRVLIDHPCEWN